MIDHPFVQMDYEARGLSARDEAVDYCETCGQHFEEHPEPTEAERDAFFDQLRDRMGRPR